MPVLLDNPFVLREARAMRAWEGRWSAPLLTALIPLALGVGAALAALLGLWSADQVWRFAQFAYVAVYVGVGMLCLFNVAMRSGADTQSGLSDELKATLLTDLDSEAGRVWSALLPVALACVAGGLMIGAALVIAPASEGALRVAAPPLPLLIFLVPAALVILLSHLVFTLHFAVLTLRDRPVSPLMAIVIAAGVSALLDVFFIGLVVKPVVALVHLADVFTTERPVWRSHQASTID